MRIVLAPDSFKESMSALTAAEAMARGVRAVLPDATCVPVPMADGGEGTTDALVAARGGTLLPVTVRGPLGGTVAASVGLLPDEGAGAGATAVVEAAAAVGVALVPTAGRDPLRATSWGVGELVRHALGTGARRVVVGLGGTLTNDGGAGLLAALGVRLLDARGGDLPPGAEHLRHLDRLDATGLDPRLARTELLVASDVTAPLLGPTGASAVFGPQKGASPGDVALLDAALAVLAPHLAALAGRDVAAVRGAGAAGGLGAALLALGAALRPGVELVAEAAGLADALVGADLVLTGEGAVDAQTMQGKVPAGVARAARRAGVPVVVLAGRVDDDAAALLDDGAGAGGPGGAGGPAGGVVALVPVGRGPRPLDEALRHGPDDLEAATATVCRLLVLGGRLSPRRAAPAP